MKLPRLLDVRTLGLALLLSSIVVAAQLDKVVIDDDLEGPNVCKEVEQFQLFVTAPREVTYQERYQKWCVAVPPRCSAYRVKTRIVNETTSVTKERILKKCCAGYEKNKAGDRCIPLCSDGCKHGDCIAPETCRCDQGYVGKTCNISELIRFECLWCKCPTWLSTLWNKSKYLPCCLYCLGAKRLITFYSYSTNKSVSGNMQAIKSTASKGNDL